MQDTNTKVKQSRQQKVKQSELPELVKDIADFILDNNKLPTIQEVIDWAEWLYKTKINNSIANQLIKEGAEKAGWRKTE